MPKIMNSHYHSSMSDQKIVLNTDSALTCHDASLLLMCIMPAAIRLPKTDESEFPQNHMPARKGCSDLRYQREVRRVNPGDRLASVHPRKNRVTIKVANFFVAAWHARTIAHSMLIVH